MLAIVQPAYPGKLIKRGHTNKSHVEAVQKRINEVGAGPLDVNGDFGVETERAVKLFQARAVDTNGMSLVIDGKVGPVTWAALFGLQTVPVTVAAQDPLLAKLVSVAQLEIGVMEEPPGSNRGPRVDQYIGAVGRDPAGKHPWCVAFTFWCFQEAAEPGKNPHIKTAGVLDHWNKAGRKEIRRIAAKQAVDQPSLVQPGHLFIIDTGPSGGAGHTGIVERVEGGLLVTIEGNTNAGGSREGVGVFRRAARKINSINKGFIDYSGS